VRSFRNATAPQLQEVQCKQELWDSSYAAWCAWSNVGMGTPCLPRASSLWLAGGAHTSLPAAPCTIRETGTKISFARCACITSELCPVWFAVA